MTDIAAHRPALDSFDEPVGDEQAAPATRVRGYWQSVFYRLRHDPATLAFGAIVLAGICAPLIAPFDPYKESIVGRLKPFGWRGHLLGSDELGRDMLSRLIYGGRVSPLMGVVPVLIASLIGDMLGVIAGFVGGRVNTAIMRTMDVFYAFPSVCGEDVLAMSARELRELRGGLVSMVFQEPMTALDPVYTVGQQIGETVRRHIGLNRSAARARALELVHIPSAERRLDSYPHELSGGLRQRAMIAMALSCNPRLLLADEPTTALDATVQVQVLILLRRLQQDLGMGMIFVTHDLGVAAEIADTVAVMYAGRIVESGPVATVLGAPAHPHTAGLLASTVHGQSRERDIEAIPGSPPDMRRLSTGCSFAPRCAQRTRECRLGVPDPRFPGPDRMAACFRVRIPVNVISHSG